MAEVKWIKLNIDMFDNRKIKYLRTLPEGNNIVLIWVMLLTIAGRCNSSGTIFLTENIPYTTNMLAEELGFETNTVVLALDQLEKLGMVIRDESEFFIPSWAEYQNVEGMERAKELKRERDRRYYQNKKALQARIPASIPAPDSTDSDAVDIDRDKDKDIKNNSIESNDSICRTKDVRRIVEAWNSLGLQQVTKVTSDSKRGAMLRSRVNEYGVEAVLKAIENIRNSPFLKGQGNRGWVITFEWFVKPNNFIKVLENSYEEAEKDGRKSTGNESVSGKGHGNTPQSRYGPSEYKYD